MSVPEEAVVRRKHDGVDGESSSTRIAPALTRMAVHRITELETQ